MPAICPEVKVTYTDAPFPICLKQISYINDKHCSIYSCLVCEETVCITCIGCIARLCVLRKVNMSYSRIFYFHYGDRHDGWGNPGKPHGNTARKGSVYTKTGMCLSTFSRNVYHIIRSIRKNTFIFDLLKTPSNACISILGRPGPTWLLLFYLTH